MPKSNRNCAVGGCSHTQRNCPKGRFVGFPNQDRQPERRQTWINLVQRGVHWIPTKNSRVCGCHFIGGYKVDDPNDPAYNPSIFPLAPELDRRVKKTLREEFHFTKQTGRQEVQYDNGAMTLELPLQPSSDPANDNDDIMKFVSAALDLSKEAGEAYALASSNANSEHTPKVGSIPLGAGPPVYTSSCQPQARQHLITTVAGKQQYQGNFRHAMRSTAAMTSGRGRLLGTPTSGRAERQASQMNSQDHSWVYFNQDRNEDSAINLTSGSNEYTGRRRRTLYSTKQQHGARFQRFAGSNRRMLGTSSSRVLGTSSSRIQRGMQSRYIVKTTSGGTEKTQTRDVSTSQENLTTENLSEAVNINSVVPQEDEKPPQVREKTSCDVCNQTIVSMEPQDDSLFGLSNLLPPSRGKCYGFHGWSDVCVSARTVKGIAGVTPEVFDLLLSCLPEDLLGLPQHNSLLLVLMKLKMAMPFEFLATVFGITSLTACNIFTHLLCVLVAIVSDLIQVPWMPTEQTQSERSVKVKSMIDFLEIRIEQEALSEHYDAFFCHESGGYCVKIILGLLPNGLINFISQAYAGSTKAIDIFTDSDLLHFLERNSTVLLLQSNPYRRKWLREKGFKVVTSSFASSQTSNKLVASSLDEFLETENGLESSIDLTANVEHKVIQPVADVPEVMSVSPTNPMSELESIPPSATVSEFTSIPSPATSLSVKLTEQKQPDHCSPDLCTHHICARRGAQRLRSFSILTSTFEGSLLPYVDDVVRLCAALSNLQEP